jgi:hypothetical protein
MIPKNNDMRHNIVVDLDGTIVDIMNCDEKCDYEDYPKNCENLRRDKCPMVNGAFECLLKLKKLGFKIIIWTSRVESERVDTVMWLKKNNIPFDELVMEKPRGFIYIDDMAHPFNNWYTTLNEICRRVEVMNDVKVRV